MGHHWVQQLKNYHWGNNCNRSQFPVFNSDFFPFFSPIVQLQSDCRVIERFKHFHLFQYSNFFTAGPGIGGKHLSSPASTSGAAARSDKLQYLARPTLMLLLRGGAGRNSAALPLPPRQPSQQASNLPGKCGGWRPSGSLNCQFPSKWTKIVGQSSIRGLVEIYIV